MPKIQRRDQRHAISTDDPRVSSGDALDSLGWNRPSVTFRLTQERRKALLALSPELGLRASPTAAIDFAIERAAGLGAASRAIAERGVGGDLDAALDLRAVLAACAALRADAEEARASLARVEIHLATLGSESSPSANSRDETRGAASSLGMWLGREAPVELTWAVVRIRWLEAAPAGPGAAVVRVNAWVAAPLEFSSLMTGAHILEIGPMRVAALAAFENDSEAVVVCSKASGGWIARIHALNAGGKLGPALDSFAA